MAKRPAVTFAESAILDLEEMREYYLEQKVPEVGDRFVREIIALVEELPAHPEKGRIVPEFGQPKLRELIHPPFRIVYRLGSHCLSIVRIWRSERLMRMP